jgi:hypothetical protein
MTTRKPKLNLLYTADSSIPWLQLAVVTPTQPNPSREHARRWQAAHFAETPLPPAAPHSKH